MKQKLPKIVCVVGSTGSGKSELALRLAKKFNGEIVVADARQVYVKMKIGTNSPTDVERKEIPHHLCNFVDPSEKYNVAEYQKQAVSAISEILQRKKLPILVGGTGLYIRAVIDNYDFAKTKPDVKFREQLEKESLEDLLKKVDQLPLSTLSATDRKNKRRIIRALEIGKRATQGKSTKAALYSVLQLAPSLDRAQLYEQINARVPQMLKNGLEDEVRALSKTYSWDSQAMSGIGYREFQRYFSKEISKVELVAKIQQDTRRYAKKQLTWFRADKRIHWVGSTTEAEKLVQNFLH